MSARLQHGHFLLVGGVEKEMVDGPDLSFKVIGYFATRSNVKEAYAKFARRLTLCQMRPAGYVYAFPSAMAAQAWIDRGAMPELPDFAVSMTSNHIGVRWEKFRAGVAEGR